MKKAFIVQARMTSSRLPGKVGLDICGKPVLYRMIERLRLTRHKDMDIIIATTTNAVDDPIVSLASECGVKVFRGSEDHVLSRYYDAAKEHGIDVICRVCSDNLLFDPRWLVDDVIDEVIENGTYDYVQSGVYDSVNNKWEEREPCWGCRCEVFTFKGLERCMQEATDRYCIEHVTPYFYMNMDLFNCAGRTSGYFASNAPFKKFDTTLDTAQDLEFLRNVYSELYPSNPAFGILNVIECCKRHPEWKSNEAKTAVTYHGEGNKNTQITY